MTYQVKRSDLKGVYQWGSNQCCVLDSEIDKMNGYEVLMFIQDFYNEREWLTDSNIHAIEAYLKLSFLHDVTSVQKLACYLRKEFA